MTKDGSNPSKWTQAEREEDPDGFAAVEAERTTTTSCAGSGRRS